MDSVSYIHCPGKMAAINTLALKRWLTFIQGFVIQQLLQHSWLYLLVNVSFLTGLVSSQVSPYLFFYSHRIIDKRNLCKCLRPLKYHAVLSESPQIDSEKKKEELDNSALELLGLIQTHKRIEHNLQMEKKTQFVMRGKTDKTHTNI